MHTLKTKRVNQKWKFFLSSFPLNTNIIRVNDLYNFRRYYFEPGQRCDANAGGFMPWKKIKKLKVHCTIFSFSIIQLWTSHSSFKTLAADQHIIICWYFEKNQSVTIKLEFSRYPNVGVLAVFPSENIPAHNFFVWIAITAVLNFGHPLMEVYRYSAVLQFYKYKFRPEVTLRLCSSLWRMARFQVLLRFA